MNTAPPRGRLYGAAINAPLLGAKLILERKDKLPEPFTPERSD